MRNRSVDLHVFYPTNEDGSRRGSEHPILRAARQGDADELKELLQEKCINYNSAQPYHRYVYPEDWKYHYKDLLETRDHEGRTALHLAAGVGDDSCTIKHNRYYHNFLCTFHVSFKLQAIMTWHLPQSQQFWRAFSC